MEWEAKVKNSDMGRNALDQAQVLIDEATSGSVEKPTLPPAPQAPKPVEVS